MSSPQHKGRWSRWLWWSNIIQLLDGAGDGSAFNDFIRRSAQWPQAIAGWDPRTEADKFLPYLPVRQVTPGYPPTFLIHGMVDTDVPFTQPQQMAAEFARLFTVLEKALKLSKADA